MAIADLHFKMADKRFLIALHHGYMTCPHVSPVKQNQYDSQQTRTCVPNRELLSKYRIIFLSSIMLVVEMVKMFEDLRYL